MKTRTTDNQSIRTANRPVKQYSTITAIILATLSFGSPTSFAEWNPAELHRMHALTLSESNSSAENMTINNSRQSCMFAGRVAEHRGNSASCENDASKDNGINTVCSTWISVKGNDDPNPSDCINNLPNWKFLI